MPWITAALLTLFSSVSLWEYSAAAPRLPHVKQYEVVQLQPLKGRTKRSASPQQKYPDTAEYALNVDGKNLTIYLEKNRELLGKDYTLTYYTEDGMKETTPQSNTDHCYYQGNIQHVNDSSVSVGLCSGMRGFLRAESQLYLIEPLEESLRGDHAIYKQEHLRTKRATVNYVNDTVYDLGPRFSGLYNGRNMKNKVPVGGQWFVEMVLVVDYKEFNKIGSLKSVEKRMLEVANHVDKLYRPLNIRVMLVGLEVWSYNDKFDVSSAPSVTLDRFSKWRQSSLLPRKKHDNAQFVTAMDFDGTTVGLAPLHAMCSPTSGAVNEDHSDNPIGVASTIAHEMGHNLGMSHDDSSCGCSSSASQSCVMGESIGLVYPEAFSRCSQISLEMFLQNYDSSCLLDVPNEADLYGGPVCGNAFVEKGEECDCGTVEECKNPCCNATNCRLTEGSQCAHGECCRSCQLKESGSMCRPSAHDCDLEEYCTGESAHCPKDDYKMNGLPCNSYQGYCYNGQCPTLTEHCKILWGQDADVDVNACFENNVYDKSCPRSRSGKCAPEHMKCGKIFCLGGNEFPRTNRKFTFTKGMKTCYSALDAFETDSLGMVPTGTKCGTNKVCYNGLCQDMSVYGTKNCSAKCSNRGVCNHEKQCHCDPGWASPYCDVKQSDFAKRNKAMVIGVTTSIAILLLITLVVGASVCYMKQKKPFINKRTCKDTFSGQSNPVFQSGSAKNSPRCGPPRISQPTFLESTASRACKPLCTLTTPSRPPPQPPKIVAEPRMEQIVKPSGPPPVVTSHSYAIQAKPLLPPSKPLPPSRPLPPLMSKPVNKPKQPPVPPVKSSGTQPAYTPAQVAGPQKVPLKPPTKFR
ncbi:disintegrin and metalloproteinase domain-containing protein 8a [Hoplias malabaricus]|uniref:disintegrin and metalloproteinase domain-containing protein 8a n=1 Tax=Hoplias malabaricus TaxID=27720 RepID=UPI0034628337